MRSRRAIDSEPFPVHHSEEIHMSHFYGTVKGSRGIGTRMGGKGSGLTTHAAGWNGAIRVTVSHSETHGDVFEVELVPWQGSGGTVVTLARGLLDANLGTKVEGLAIVAKE